MKCLLTWFYGQHDIRREKAWNFLTSLKSNGHQGWCVIGDFNKMLIHDEKIGGRPRQERQMVCFKEALEKGNFFY